MAKNAVDLCIDRKRQCLFLILSYCLLIGCMLLQLAFQTADCLHAACNTIEFRYRKTSTVKDHSNLSCIVITRSSMERYVISQRN